MSVGDGGKRGTGKGEGGRWGSRGLARRGSDNAMLLVYELTDAFFSLWFGLVFGCVCWLGVVVFCCWLVFEKH